MTMQVWLASVWAQGVRLSNTEGLDDCDLWEGRDGRKHPSSSRASLIRDVKLCPDLEEGEGKGNPENTRSLNSGSPHLDSKKTTSERKSFSSWPPRPSSPHTGDFFGPEVKSQETKPGDRGWGKRGWEQGSRRRGISSRRTKDCL